MQLSIETCKKLLNLYHGISLTFMLLIAMGVLVFFPSWIIWLIIMTWQFSYNVYNIYILIIITVIIVITISVLGFLGTAKSGNHRILYAKCFVMSAFVMVQMALLACLFVLVNQNQLETIMRSSLTHFKINDGVEKIWNILQNNLACCGVSGPNDWFIAFQWPQLPLTCCDHSQVIPGQPGDLGRCQMDAGAQDHFAPYMSGCLQVLESAQGWLVIGLPGLILILIQFAVIVITYQYIKMDKKTEDVEDVIDGVMIKKVLRKKMKTK